MPSRRWNQSTCLTTCVVARTGVGRVAAEKVPPPVTAEARRRPTEPVARQRHRFANAAEDGSDRDRHMPGRRKTELPAPFASREMQQLGPDALLSQVKAVLERADSGISRSEVSRICADLDEEVGAFRDRSLSGAAFPYVPEGHLLQRRERCREGRARRSASLPGRVCRACAAARADRRPRRRGRSRRGDGKPADRAAQVSIGRRRADWYGRLTT